MLMRFDPFADIDRLTRQAWGGSRPGFMPADAYRLGDRFFLHIDLPGINPDGVDITVENNTLTVTAERRWEKSEETQVLHAERPYGSFTRQFFLGDSLDADRIEAGYDHGVLTISIPVAETARPRKIEVGSVREAIAG
jgi:HSP20 family protein